VRTVQWISIVWVVVAVLLIVGSSKGGDLTIITGLLWLIWTAPVGMIWQFWLYPTVDRVLGTDVTDWFGIGLVFVGGYLFWFSLVPWLFRAARRRHNIPQ
jgi:hypothetical protein